MHLVRIREHKGDTDGGITYTATETDESKIQENG
jgi:hypothetical protein